MRYLRQIRHAITYLTTDRQVRTSIAYVRERFKACNILLLYVLLSFLTMDSVGLLANSSDDEIEKIKLTIRNFRSVHGTAINLEDYNELIYNRPTPIEWRFGRDIWLELKASQNPDVSLSQLEKIIRSKQDTLTRLKYKCNSRRSCPNKSISPAESESVTEFVKYKSLLFKAVRTRDISTGKTILWNTTAYDGKTLKVLDYPLDSNLDSPVPNATISKLTDKTTFFDANNLLVQSLLLSSQDTEEVNSPIYNLSSFLHSDGVILFENHITIDGYDCLLITDGLFQIYLSVEMDYTPVRIDTYLTDPQKDREHLHQRILYSSCSHKDFKMLQNSIWFPGLVETTVTHPSHLFDFVDRITYTDVSLDFDMHPAFFQDVIPDGTIVVDGIRNMVYKWGDRASIGTLIKETVKSKRQTIFRNLSVVLGLCFIACWGIVEWRKRRLLKGEVE